MEEEWSLNVLWAYDDRKFKEGQKYKLSSDLVRILHRKFCSLAIGKHVTGFTMLVITSTTGNDTSFLLIHGFRDTNGTIGLLFILRKKLRMVK